jgi:Concanavalin A-like lectin/glucanases superfamily
MLNQETFSRLLPGNEERTLRSACQKAILQQLLGRSAWVAALALFATTGPVGAGLVGLWQFNEGSGQVVNSAVNGLAGYLGTSSSDTVRDPTWSASGSPLGAGGGSALYFTAGLANYRAQVDHTSLLAPTNALTLAVDFNPDAFPQGVLVCKHSGSTSGSYMLSITPANGYYSFTVINASSVRVNLNWPIPTGDAGTWHQLAGTYDSATGNMKLYYDGILRTNTAQTGKIKVVTAPLMFGNYNADNTLWEYAGYIDNGALFDTALSDGGVAVGQPAAAGSDIYKLFHSGAVSFVPAMIVTNAPVSQALAVGGTATFSVGVSGGRAPLTYRWQFNGTNIAGATTNQWTVSNAQLTNAGNYAAVITDANSLSVTSPAAILLVGTVGHNLVGLWQFDEGTDQIIHDSSGNGLDGYLGTSPSDATYDATWSTTGSTLGAGGGGALYFPPGQFDIQGRVNNTPLLTPSSALTIAADIQWDNSGTYGVIVSKHGGSTSGSYLLDITSTITQFEFMVINASGTRVNLDWTFPPGDAGNGYHQLVGTYDGLTMRLYYDGVLVATAAQSGGIQVVSAPLLIGNFNAPTTLWEYTGLIDNVALFSTALSDGGGAVGQPAASGSDIYKLLHQGAVSFVPAMILTNRPASQAVALGGTATFNVGVSGGAAPLAYQWQLNGTNVGGATTTQLTISSASLADAGSYTAIVTDSSSLSVTSPPALLLVGTVGHNLVGLWQFDEGTGQIIHDRSGNGLDGYLGLTSWETTQDAEWSTNGSPLGAAGGTVQPGNNALFFPSGVPSSSNDVARVDNTPLLTPTNALTLAADIQWNMAGTHGVIVSKHGGSSTGPYLLDVASDNVSFDFMVVTATGGRVDLYWAFPPGDVGGSFHQLVGTYDGLTMRLYYDGVLEATNAQSGRLAVTQFPLLIGDYCQTNVPVPGIWQYEGLIDNVALFSTALSDGGVAVGEAAAAGSDIYKLFQQGAVAFTPPHITAALSGPNTLVLNWVGTNILDSASNVTGPWTPVTTNASPYNVDVTAQSGEFFRCRRL